MEIFIVLCPPVRWERRTRAKNVFPNKDIKRLIEKYLKLLFKTFRTSFSCGSLQPYKFIRNFIYCNNFIYFAPGVLINVFPLIKISFRAFFQPFSHFLCSSRRLLRHYKYLLWAMKNTANEKVATNRHRVEIKLVRKTNIWLLRPL